MHTTRTLRTLRTAAAGLALVVAVGATAASGEEETASGDDAAKTTATPAAGDTTATTAATASGGQSTTTISKGLGSQDASADVTGPTIVREGEDPFVLVYGQVTITNGSSKASDYFVTVAAESPDGKTRYDETFVTVDTLEPGQTATEKGIFTKDVPADAVLVVKEVQRTAS